MSEAPRIVLRPNPDMTAEQGRDARACCWRFVFDAYTRKNPAAGPSGRGDYDGKAKGDSADEPIVQH